MRIAAVDLVSNTCFPALAAYELGFFQKEGLDVEIELVAALGATKALRDGKVDGIIAGSVFDLLTEFPDWKGTKLCVALSQGTPWLLTIKSDLLIESGNIIELKGLTVTAAEGPDLVLKQLLRTGGLDPENDLNIIDLPGAKKRNVSFGIFAAEALSQGRIDGYWSNAMGAHTAVNRGVGKIHIDVRRGDDPGEVRYATCAGLAVTDNYLEKEPESVEAAVRAIVKAQRALKSDPLIAIKVGEKLFPPEATNLISDIIKSDTPFYDPSISRTTIRRINAFAQSVGQLTEPIPYEYVVAERCIPIWKE